MSNKERRVLSCCHMWMLAGQGRAGRPSLGEGGGGEGGERVKKKKKKKAAQINRWDCQIELRSLFVSPKRSRLLAHRQNMARH